MFAELRRIFVIFVVSLSVLTSSLVVIGINFDSSVVSPPLADPPSEEKSENESKLLEPAQYTIGRLKVIFASGTEPEENALWIQALEVVEPLIPEKMIKVLIPLSKEQEGDIEFRLYETDNASWPFSQLTHRSRRLTEAKGDEVYTIIYQNPDPNQKSSLYFGEHIAENGIDDTERLVAILAALAFEYAAVEEGRLNDFIEYVGFENSPFMTLSSVQDYTFSFAIFTLWPDYLSQCCSKRFEFFEKEFGLNTSNAAYVAFPGFISTNLRVNFSESKLFSPLTLNNYAEQDGISVVEKYYNLIFFSGKAPVSLLKEECPESKFAKEYEQRIIPQIEEILSYLPQRVHEFITDKEKNKTNIWIDCISSRGQATYFGFPYNTLLVGKDVPGDIAISPVTIKYVYIDFVIVTVHEIGHLLHWSSDQSGDRIINEYKEVIISQRAIDTQEFPPTIHGFENIWEDFAGAFVFYVLYPEYLKEKKPLRYQFMKDLVKQEYENLSVMEEVIDKLLTTTSIDLLTYEEKMEFFDRYIETVKKRIP